MNRQPLDEALVDPARQRNARISSAVVGFGGVGLLAVSAWLTPAVQGHSTHTQLGLLPCTFLALSGYPCPMCGATTSFALMAEGRVPEALVTQPFAAFLFVLTVVVTGVSLTEAAVPRGRWTKLSYAMRPHELRLAAGFLLAMFAGWIWKIAMMH